MIKNLVVTHIEFYFMVKIYSENSPKKQKDSKKTVNCSTNGLFGKNLSVWLQELQANHCDTKRNSIGHKLGIFVSSNFLSRNFLDEK